EAGAGHGHGGGADHLVEELHHQGRVGGPVGKRAADGNEIDGLGSDRPLIYAARGRRGPAPPPP
ncbi:MAG: hypothetical protein ACT4OP_00360, partial [Actinomycetota bacterium]